MKLSRILPLVVGSAVAGVVVSMSPAQAIIFNVNGIDYDVTTVTTSYDANRFLLESQPWWNNEPLASQFASTVELALPGSSVATGPNFAFNPTVTSYVAVQGLSNAFINTSQPSQTTVYATATPVPFDTTPGAMLTSIPILALMYRWKQSRNRIALKSINNSGVTVSTGDKLRVS